MKIVARNDYRSFSCVVVNMKNSKIGLLFLKSVFSKLIVLLITEKGWLVVIGILLVQKCAHLVLMVTVIIDWIFSGNMMWARKFFICRKKGNYRNLYNFLFV